MTDRPRVLAVAGLDPTGGAGVLADVRTITLHGAVGLGVVTCTTVQNRHRFVRASAIDTGEFRAMLEAVAADGPIDAVKIGMVPAGETATVLAAFLDALPGSPAVVLDPVLSATAGGGEVGLARVKANLLDHLVPRAAVVTPNRPELERLADGDPSALVGRGARAVLVKGGHGDGERAIDVLHTARDAVVVADRPRLDVGPVHGTGCALASALAARLAHGDAPGDAARTAADWVARCLAATRGGDDGLPVPLELVPPRVG